MLDAAPQQQKILTGPRCDHCCGGTSVLGITPHRRRKWSHVWMLECMLCGMPQTIEKQIPQHPH